MSECHPQRYLPFHEVTHQALEAAHRRAGPNRDFVTWLDCEIAGLFCEWEAAWIVHVRPDRCSVEVGPVSAEVAWTLSGIALAESSLIEDVCAGFAAQILARMAPTAP